MKNMKFKLISCLILLSTFAIAQTKYQTRNEYRGNCSGSGKILITTEQYNADLKVISSKHLQSNRKTIFNYNNSGNLISKIHSDSTGKIIRFNKIYYNENNEYTTDTLFDSDSSVATIFRRRHSKKPNEDILTWDNLKQKGSTIIQTIKLDGQKNEIENAVCTSSAECTITKNTFSGTKKTRTEIFRTEEMSRKPRLIESQVYEYDSADRLIKITYTNEVDKLCKQILTYTYQ